ncbi:MAG: MarC family protein [Bacteroidaceae bacterium]|nr:MarC family protein [Bacteroidaceae bacterium]
MLASFDFMETLSSFIIMFAIIDVLGATPVILTLRDRGKEIHSLKATVFSALILVGFFYLGDLVLKLFNVDIQSFAVAGSILLFLMALEMLLDIEIFKYSGPTPDATVIPLVFPLLAGAGAITTLISLKAEFADINILCGLILNMVWVYIVLKMTDRIRKFFGKNGIYVMKKFFGVILLAISVRLFTANLHSLIGLL